MYFLLFINNNKKKTMLNIIKITVTPESIKISEFYYSFVINKNDIEKIVFLKPNFNELVF